MIASGLAFKASDLHTQVLGTFMGRDALTVAASWLSLTGSDTVLLPAYVCEEVVKPFARIARTAFYDIGPDLTIDPDMIRVQLSHSRVKALVFVNYFGFLQPYREDILALCAERGVVLIEDCAHSLLTAGSGSVGDFAIYSFRKVLPVPDGGGLRVNRGVPGAPPQLHPRIYSDLLSICIMAKARVKVRARMFSRAGMTSSANKLASARAPREDVATQARRILPLSSFTRHRMEQLSFPDVIQRRRADFNFWQALSEKNGCMQPLFGNLPEGVCPLGFPAFVPDRETFRSRADNEGIYVKVHWRLPSSIDGSFYTSHDVARRMVTLPVYPELSDRERDVLVRLLGTR